MKNTVFLDIEILHTDDHGDLLIQCTLETFVIYSVYKYCDPSEVDLHLVSNTLSPKSTPCIKTKLKGNAYKIVSYPELPWDVVSCKFPVVKCDDTTVTGICAVARHICKHRMEPRNEQEHDEGLLGFRKSCLQAPNEVSVWTKFCEVDIMRTVRDVLSESESGEGICTLPINIVRFENHLQKPVKVHNVYKIAREKSKQQSLEVKLARLVELTLSDGTKCTEGNESLARQCKTSKWKSQTRNTLIESSTPIEELDVYHKFAEGPYLTLADLILYPCVKFTINVLGYDNLQRLLPKTCNWLTSLEQIRQFQVIKDLMKACTGYTSHNRQVKFELPLLNNVSLYTCDPKRSNPRKRIYTKENDIVEALGVIKDDMELPLKENMLDDNEIAWCDIPPGANPSAGHLPDKRMERKSQQLENLALAVVKVANDGDRIVDFCSGSGHLGILIAHLLPRCTVILLENKEQSLLRARTRVHEMGLRNVFFFQCNLDFFTGKFDVGVALHACGVASDLVLDKCIKANAKFVLCPCCYGSVHETERIMYPRSNVFSELMLRQYICIGHAADQTHTNHPQAIRGARCMAIIDSDRGRFAEEAGYCVTLSRLKPLSCTPKNNLLIGLPA